MWFLNPKNLILCALAVIVAVVGGLYLWQRGTIKDKEIIIVQKTNEITSLTKANADLQGQIKDYKANLSAAKKAQASQQQIQTTTAEIRYEVQQIKTQVILEEDDEKIISDATYYFNSHGLRRGETGDSSSKASGEVLPVPSEAGPDRSHHWTVKQIVSNYLELIDYTLKLERTVECYESD